MTVKAAAAARPRFPAGTPATPPAGKPRLMLVAEVLRAHGLEGTVQAKLLADSWEALGCPRALYLEGAEGGAAGGAPPASLPVELVGGGGTRLLLKLAGVETREQAAALAGRRLGIPRAAAPPLPEGRYYHYDLLGLTVEDGEGRDLGQVAEIVPTPGNDVYVVRGARGEWLLPAVRRVIAAVDLEAGVLRVRDVTGLLDEPSALSPRPSPLDSTGGRTRQG